ncbi:putative FAD dependent oxidoreductase, partial [Talaromyces proteolyticus]
MHVRAVLSNTASLALLGAIVPAAADICSNIKTASSSSDILSEPLSLAYETEIQNYWSAACSGLRPTCMVFPTSAEEVSDIIQALQQTDDLFAVKSGGHMPNNGFSSIQGGLLLSTKNLNNIVAYDADTQTAKIGPGLTWAQAQQGLEGTGMTVVGGRLGGVGIGGYILGAGLSFLSAQYGWAANNVVDLEVVLANGTIVHANDFENEDLFAALKGGGSSFGIVTQYTLKTYPIADKVWGGVITFGQDKTPQVLEAIRNFVEYYPDDKAAIIPTCEHTALFTSWFVFFFYDGETAPAGVFDNFTDIGSLTSTVQTWDSYYDLLQSNDEYDLHGQRYAIATETTPLPSAEFGTEVLTNIWETFYNITSEVILDTGMIGTIAMQPMSRTITSKAKALGGDLLDFPDTTDYIIFELDISHSLSLDDDTTEAAIESLYTSLGNVVENYIREGKLPDVYRPLFMNDAHGTQDYWGRIAPSSRAFAKQVREKYDPELFWQKRTSGGFRLG